MLLSSDLYTGCTRANFQSLANVPVCNEILKIFFRDGATMSAEILSTLAGILSIPVDFKLLI